LRVWPLLLCPQSEIFPERPSNRDGYRGIVAGQRLCDGGHTIIGNKSLANFVLRSVRRDTPWLD